MAGEEGRIYKYFGYGYARNGMYLQGNK